MIKNQYKSLLVTMFFFVSPLSYADLSDESINELLDLSGLTMQIGQFPGLIKAEIQRAKQQKTPISDTAYNLMINSVDKSILPSDIIGEIKISLKESITENEARKILTWYKSDLGKEITHAEENATTPDAYQKMTQSAESLLANSERVEFANKLDVLLAATDMQMDTLKYSSIAIYSAFQTVMQPCAPFDIESMKSKLDTQNEQTYAAFKRLITISFLYSYQDIEMEKLKKYENFLINKATKKFNKAIMGSISRGFESSISKWASELANAFLNMKQKS